MLRGVKGEERGADIKAGTEPTQMKTDEEALLSSKHLLASLQSRSSAH